MDERICHDDDPADTAATRWLRTTLGKRTIDGAPAFPATALRRAFRAGFLLGAKTERKNAKEEPR